MRIEEDTEYFTDPTDENRIPFYTRTALDSWNVGQSYPTGDFLRAVLTNDLMGAFGRADTNNIKALHAIVAYVYNHLNPENHGSEERYEKWWKKFQQLEESLTK